MREGLFRSVLVSILKVFNSIFGMPWIAKKLWKIDIAFIFRLLGHCSHTCFHLPNLLFMVLKNFVNQSKKFILRHNIEC